MKRGKKSSWLKWGLLGVAILLIAGCRPGPVPPGGEGPEQLISSLIQVVRTWVLQVLLPPNSPPAISSLTANPASVETEGSSTVTVVASEPDGDPLSYSWTATGGALSPVSGSSSTTWTAPASPGTYTVTVTVTDGRGGSASHSVSIAVAAPPLPGTGAEG